MNVLSVKWGGGIVVDFTSKDSQHLNFSVHGGLQLEAFEVSYGFDLKTVDEVIAMLKTIGDWKERVNRIVLRFGYVHIIAHKTDERGWRTIQAQGMERKEQVQILDLLNA